MSDNLAGEAVKYGLVVGAIALLLGGIALGALLASVIWYVFG